MRDPPGDLYSLWWQFHLSAYLFFQADIIVFFSISVISSDSFQDKAQRIFIEIIPLKVLRLVSSSHRVFRDVVH